MSRTLSATAVRELLKQNSSEVFLVLLTFTHPSITTVRLVNDTQTLVSRGNTFIAFPFELNLPSDLAEQLPVATLSISNVDRRLIDELRGVDSAISVMLEVVTASAPNTLEVGPYLFDMTSVSYDQERITAELSYEPILNEPFPAASFTPQIFPQLFSR